MREHNTLGLLRPRSFDTYKEPHGNALGGTTQLRWKTNPGDATRGEEVGVNKHLGKVYFCLKKRQLDPKWRNRENISMTIEK